MPVYFARAGNDGPVKIGTATDVPARIAELQSGNHEVLSVVRLMDGGRRLEAWLHHHFARLRIRGEWFQYDPAMLTVSPDLTAAAEPIEIPAAIFELGARLGVGPAALSKWRQRGVPRMWLHDLAQQAERDGVVLSREMLERACAKRSAVAA
jgi:hypothetical protein